MKCTVPYIVIYTCLGFGKVVMGEGRRAGGKWLCVRLSGTLPGVFGWLEEGCHEVAVLRIL